MLFLDQFFTRISMVVSDLAEIEFKKILILLFNYTVLFICYEIRGEMGGHFFTLYRSVFLFCPFLLN